MNNLKLTLLREGLITLLYPTNLLILLIDFSCLEFCSILLNIMGEYACVMIMLKISAWFIHFFIKKDFILNNINLLVECYK